MPNEVGRNETCLSKQVTQKMKELLTNYHTIKIKLSKTSSIFHYKLEIIYPFQNGNGRVERLIIFKECLANNIASFIIDEHLKLFYYKGLQQWNNVKEYLMDICLTTQNNYKSILDYFKIEYN
ncbi:Fic family protein [Flavobacterium sp. CSZ]|jgi:Fic family protein|nr:Fic family protein [Flavobacterium sp. CSZ]